MGTFSEDDVVTITPLRAFPVIRDLVTDVWFNYEKAQQIRRSRRASATPTATTACSRSTSSQPPAHS
jgi:succinate dehydrogenase/fumarate reductase-like Fe-S protein